MLNQAELDGMRATSTSAMPDECEITREGGDPTLDTATGDLDFPVPVAIYQGACRVRPGGTAEQDAVVGDLHETLGDYVATVPHDAGAIEADDFLTVTSSSDPQMIGRAFRILHVGWSSWQIDRRLALEDREQPTGETGS